MNSNYFILNYIKNITYYIWTTYTHKFHGAYVQYWSRILGTKITNPHSHSNVYLLWYKVYTVILESSEALSVIE